MHHPLSDKEIPNGHKVIMGVLAGISATLILHPLDLIKVRLQIRPGSKSTLQMGRRIVHCEGARALYSGLSAGVLRQATYTSTRLGVWNWLYEKYRLKYGKSPGFKDKVSIGIVAGMAGALAGTPSEVALIRMMAAGARMRLRSVYCCPAYHLPPKKGGAIGELYRISRKEGVSALFRGARTTVLRSIIVSLVQIGTYNQIRIYLHRTELQSDIVLHLYTSLVSSFITAIMTLPVDIVKTRYQSAEGSIPTQVDIFKTLYKTRGLRRFWQGFPPYYVRMFSHTLLSYIFVDVITEVYKDIHNIED